MTESPLPRPARIAGVIFAAALGLVLVAFLLIAVWVGVRGALAYGYLRDAQAAASGVQLTDTTAAAATIAEIAPQTAAAHELTSDPIWRLAEGTPWIGPQLSAVATVAASLDDIAGTALGPLADTASGLPLDSLRPQDGRIDLAAVSDMQGAAQTAADGIAAAAAPVAAIDRAPLVTPVREAVDQVDELLTEARIATGALHRATTLLPAMLGAEGPRDYLVLFQNNAEWRSLGGMPGAVALLHTDGGAMSLVTQEAASSFPRYDTSVLPLGDEVVGIYGDHPGRWMHNVTQVPEFATTGQLAREMWAHKHGGQQVDGVIALDPVALSYLLVATGPVELSTGDTLTSETAVSLLLNETYFRYERPGEQDALFAAATTAVFDRIASGGVDPAALVEALSRAGDEHRLLLWSAHEDEQAVLADTTLVGALPQTDEEVARFGVYLNDGTGSKMDYYQTAGATLSWGACSIDPSGRAVGDATLTVTVANNAPTDAATALPGYITGGVAGLPLGVARTIVYVYLPEGFTLADATMSDGSGFGGGSHDGRRVLSFTVDLAPGQSASATITASTATPGAATVEADMTPTITSPAVVGATCGVP